MITVKPGRYYQSLASKKIFKAIEVLPINRTKIVIRMLSVGLPGFCAMKAEPACKETNKLYKCASLNSVYCNCPVKVSEDHYREISKMEVALLRARPKSKAEAKLYEP